MNIKDCLTHEWDEDEDGTAIRGQQIRTDAEAQALLDKHKTIVEKGIRLRSNCYYIAGEIVKAEEQP